MKYIELLLVFLILIFLSHSHPLSCFFLLLSKNLASGHISVLLRDNVGSVLLEKVFVVSCIEKNRFFFLQIQFETELLHHTHVDVSKRRGIRRDCGCHCARSSISIGQTSYSQSCCERGVASCSFIRTFLYCGGLLFVSNCNDTVYCVAIVARVVGS